MRIGIVGGTGPQGRGIAARLAMGGYETLLGSRSLEKAHGVLEELHQTWKDKNLSLIAGTNAQASECDFVILATAWDATIDTALEFRNHLEGKTVMSMANALTKVGREFHALVPARGSIASTIQALLPASKIVAAMHHVPAKELAALDHPCYCDVLVCTDFEEAFTESAKIMTSISGIRPIHAGSLSSAGAIESLTAVLLTVNLRYKTRTSLQLGGIEQKG